MPGQQPVLVRQELPDGHLIQLAQVLRTDLVRGIGNELQPLLHPVDAFLRRIYRRIAGEDLPHTVAGCVNLLNGQRGYDLILHSLYSVELGAALRGEQHPGGGEAHPGNPLQIDQLPAVKGLERQALIETILQQRDKFLDIRLRVQIA